VSAHGYSNVVFHLSQAPIKDDEWQNCSHELKANESEENCRVGDEKRGLIIVLLHRDGIVQDLGVDLSRAHK
jgi:hypothetical protein